MGPAPTAPLLKMSRSLLRRLGQAAKQFAAESAEGTRHAHTEAAAPAKVAVTETGARYTPNQYGRTKPMDRSGTWVPKNPYIEAWVYRRDKFEKEFSWTNRSTIEALYYIGGLTVGFYALSVWATRHSDARNNYPKRNLLGAETNTGFVLPDEREWY
mmetsp:Transcript_8544/g.21276  ORF Transcript_8544/g.21276 Transcript_8544/m.21276 type:complete len:157 (-) Transcript_8544:418-888(-)